MIDRYWLTHANPLLDAGEMCTGLYTHVPTRCIRQGVSLAMWGIVSTIRRISARERFGTDTVSPLPSDFESRLSKIDSRNLYGDLRVRSLKRSYRDCKLFSHSHDVPIDYLEGMHADANVIERLGWPSLKFHWTPVCVFRGNSRKLEATFLRKLHSPKFPNLRRERIRRILGFFCLDSRAKVWSHVIRCSFPV